MTPERIAAKIATDHYFDGNSVSLREAIATALREARNQGLEEASLAAFTHCKYPKAAKLISDRIRALKHKDGQHD